MIKSILAIAKQTAKEDLYYRFDLVLYVLNFIVEVIVYIFVWMAVYQNGGSAAQMSIMQITTYYILVVSLKPITDWGVNESIGSSIREGQIIRELLNPISYLSYNFGIKLGVLIESIIVAGITFIICSLMFTVILPQSFLHFLLFLVMVVLSIISCYFFEIIFGMMTFYTTAVWGLEVLKRAILAIFSGSIAPIYMLPGILENIAKILPFQDYIYTPIQIYLGEITGTDIATSFIRQVIWIIILYTVAKKFYQKAIKNITVYGG